MEGNKYKIEYIIVKITPVRNGGCFSLLRSRDAPFFVHIFRRK
nr:MAG TPA: hypothetical protein [Caudoviricetes sp.]